MKNKPPRWAEWLVERIAAPYLRDEILGDLSELFQRRGNRYGYSKARLFYWLDVLLLMHPRLWRRKPRSVAYAPQFTDYQNPSPLLMLSNYFKIALRKLNRNKAYTLINVVSLGLGIACAILIFTLVKYHLSFDTFHANKDRIFRVFTELHDSKTRYNPGVPNPMGDALRNGFTAFEKVGRIAFLEKRVVEISPNKKFKEDIAFADPEFLEITNFPLEQGNSKTALQERNTALITDRVAKKYFGAEDPIGKIVHVDDSLVVRITGILRDLPANTDIRPEMYIPFGNLKDHTPWMVEKDWWFSVSDDMQCYVRLKPGVSAASVDNTVLPAVSSKYYDEKMAKFFRFKLQPISDVHFNPNLKGNTEKKNLWAFGLIGLFLIITTCVNFVNLSTAQALGRSKEIGVRKVMGSQRGALFWQFMTETALITGMATLVAFGLAYLALPVVNQLFEIDLTLNPFTDIYLITFLPVLLLVVIFISGSYPGLILARFQPVMALKGKLSQRQLGGFSLRKGLVITQFAISQLLIIGTLVIANQLRYSQQADMGFEKDAVVMLPVPENKKSTINTLSAQFSELPGVESSTFFDTAPAAEEVGSTGIQFDSRTESETFSIAIKAADDRFVPTFEIPMVAGRNLNPSDTIREYIVNESAVKALQLKSNQEVVGKRAVINGRPGTIVGVMKDFHYRSFHVGIEPLCITTRSENYMNCAVKVNLRNLPATLAGLEKSWSAMYPSSIFTYQFLDEEIERFYKLDTMMLRLIQAFAGIAIFIGCLGLYGLISFMAEQKNKEIGVRKVLGASVPSILWLFCKEFARLLLIAFVLAAPLAWWVMNGWLNNFVYRIELGAGIFALAIVITVVISVLTVGYRSMKAALMNPIKSLRSE
ncbi:ABC transporter permease [Larkinella terrae]|nr:ABC transporter permease [Larkinella terrae]